MTLFLLGVYVGGSLVAFASAENVEGPEGWREHLAAAGLALLWPLAVILNGLAYLREIAR